MDRRQSAVDGASFILDGVAKNWTHAVSDDDEPAGVFLLQVMAKSSGPVNGTDIFTPAQQMLAGLLYSGKISLPGTTVSEWFIFLALVLGFLLIDALILQRRNAPDGFWGNLAILAFWVCAGLTYNVYFYWRFGAAPATDWFVGYLLEWMLSIDNLFVFHIIFRFYKMPPVLMKKALFFGITGAVLFRMLTFFTIGSLLHLAHWFRRAIGVALIYSAYQAVNEADDEEHDVSQTYGVSGLRWLLGNRLVERLDTPEAAEGRLLVWDSSGRTCVTLTAFVILLLEVTDICFALDSVSAKIGQIPNLYVAYTSSILAVFGLRAMFFVIRELVECFDMLKYGICMVLVFIGVQMILDPWVHLRPSTACVVVVLVFIVCIAMSAVRMATATKPVAGHQQAGMAKDGTGQLGWKPTFAPEEVAGGLHSASPPRN